MKEDFGVAPRRGVSRAGEDINFTDLTSSTPQTRINVDKYRPASQITARQDSQAADAEDYSEGQAVAVAIQPNDSIWQNSPLLNASDEDTDTSGSHDYYPDDESKDGGKPADEDDDEPKDGDEQKPKKNPFGKVIAFFKGLSRKQWLIIGGVALILIAGTASYLLTRPEKSTSTATVKQAKKAAPAPAPKPTSPLTGLETSLEDTKRPVIGVMIENSTFARPQSGLKDAGVVYEAIAEYGITRFLAVFQEAKPENVGPVRSARPYFVDWAHSYDAAYAHVGGSPDALAKIKADGVRDLDQFANGGSYRRISQREAPHNVYTSMQNLRDLTATKGYTSSTFTAWPRKKDEPAKTVTASSIDIAISGPTYNVHYDYDAASNSYLRTMGGAPHTDADSGARLAPKVVIGLAAPYSLLADNYHSSYVTVGSGSAKIFQDGTITDATWKREGNETYKFLDKNNKEIKLDAGQTWITVVGDPAAVTYAAPAPAPATSATKP